MRAFKRILACLMACLLLLPLGACGGTVEDTTPAATTPATTPADTTPAETTPAATTPAATTPAAMTPAATTPAATTPAATAPAATTPAATVPAAPEYPMVGGKLTSLAIDFRGDGSTLGTVEAMGNVFYLPSFADVTALPIALEGTSAVVYYSPDTPADFDVTFTGGTIDISGMLTTDKRDKACYKVVFRVDKQEHTYTFYVGGNIPAVFINTSAELEWIEKNKENRDKKSNALVLDAGGNLVFTDATDKTSELKVRGNGSMNLAKKSYQLKLSAKSPMFHMPEAKNWILLPNYDDQSLLRNSTVYSFAKQLGFEAMEFQSVDLYINGEYRGVYLLTEKVEIQSSRVAITELEKLVEDANPNVNFDILSRYTSTNVGSTYLNSYTYFNLTDPEDITGGYLVELDNNYGKDEPSMFSTKRQEGGSDTWVVKSPEYASQAQMEYISGLFADLVEAMDAPDGYNAKGKHYSEYIDMDSFALGYLVSEISKNWDSGSSSHFFYKEQDVNGVTGKIVMGPLWDCDNTLGNNNKVDDAKKIDELKTASRSIFKMLMQHDDFKALVAEKFDAAKEIALAMTAPGGDIDQFVQELGSSADMDQMRWNTYDKAKWPLYGSIYNFIHYDKWSGVPGGMFTFRAVYSDGEDLTAETTIGYLKDWFTRRIKALEPLLDPQ